MSEHRTTEQDIYRQIFEHSPLAVMYTDRKGVIIFCNGNASRVFGAPPDRLKGFSYLDIRNPAMKAAIAEALEGRESRFQGEYLTVTGNRQTHLNANFSPTYCPDGKVSGVIGIFEDISERVATSRCLRELEERYRIAFFTSPDAISLNRLDGTYVDINKGFTELTGYQREEIIGKTSTEINIWVNPADRDTLISALELEGHVKNLELLFRMKDGSFKTALMSASTITLDGQPLTLAVTKDITRLREAEQERLLLEARLLQAHRLESLGTLAGGIAHDFNNILTAILGYADLALLDLDENHRARAKIGQVIKAGQRARDMIQQILAFSRKPTGERKPVRLGDIINEVLKLLRASIPSTIEIQCEIDAPDVTILADPSQLHQLLMNLCTNAYQVMAEKGGVLSLALERLELNQGDPCLESGLMPGSYLCLSVGDTGGGIASEIIEHIFDPYFTTKEVGKGSGMGLAVVHGVAKSHGGMVKVTSKPGEGTVFRVYLPESGQPVNDGELIHGESLPGGNEKILLVDDEEVLVSLNTLILESLGYQVVGATGSRQALELFRTRPEEFDLVVTDQTMPGMTGEQLARELLSLRPGLPVLLCTGYSSGMYAERAREIGISGLLLKPMKTGELALAVRRILDR